MNGDLEIKTGQRRNAMSLAASLVMIFAVVYLDVYISNNPIQAKLKIIQAHQEVRSVYLRILEKGKIRSSFITQYYLSLSNDRVIFVTSEDYDKYEENKYYSFGDCP